jgi:hypothetical protein
MFQQFLRIVHSGSVQSHFEIAQKMDVSPDMILQIARDLTVRGYLKGAADECSTASHACTGCAMGGACHSSFSTWSLTEKGEKWV